MNETENNQHHSNESTGGSPNGCGQQQSQSDSRRCAFDSLCSAFRKGADDARAAAEEAMPRIKAAATDAAYWMTYGISFAATFQIAVIKSLTPEVIKTGWKEGSSAGTKSGEKFAAEFRQGATARSAAPPPVTPDSGAQASPA